MEIVTARGTSKDQGRRRRKASNGHVVAQLLDSPLPTPRRSCCGSAADTPRCSAGASPQRTHVPFSWESSPGVPKDACGGNLDREVLPPKPPPGRGGSGTPCHAHARAYHGNTTDATSNDDDEEDTFSDALDRISSSDRLAAFSARLSSIDGAGSRRSPSFIMDRFLLAANSIATTSADKHPKKSPRRRARCSKHEEEAPPAARRETHSPRRAPAPAPAREQPKHSPRHVHPLQREERVTPPRQSKDAAQTQRINADEQGDQVSPRACGLMVFSPWSVKPVLSGFPRSPARCWTPRAHVGTTTPSPPRRSTTLGDVLVKEGELRCGDLSHWYEKKSGSDKEWSSPGRGMAILGTSKRYCADARKALSRLARSGTDGGGSPRVSRERRSGKPVASPLRSPSGKMPQLKPPSESWLSRAREQHCCTVNNKR